MYNMLKPMLRLSQYEMEDFSQNQRGRVTKLTERFNIYFTYISSKIKISYINNGNAKECLRKTLIVGIATPLPS